MTTSYLCYIEGAGTHWQGVCVDFDLTVSGTSIDDVKGKLGHTIFTYIEDAMAEGEPHRTKLLNRRSPWTTRTYWQIHVAITQLSHRLGAMAAAITIRLPAAPCPA